MYLRLSIMYGRETRVELVNMDRVLSIAEALSHDGTVLRYDNDDTVLNVFESYVTITKWLYGREAIGNPAYDPSKAGKINPDNTRELSAVNPYAYGADFGTQWAMEAAPVTPEAAQWIKGKQATEWPGPGWNATTVWGHNEPTEQGGVVTGRVTINDKVEWK